MKSLLTLVTLILTLSASVLPKGKYPVTYALGRAISSNTYATSDGSNSLQVTSPGCANLLYKMNSGDGQNFTVTPRAEDIENSCIQGEVLKKCFGSAASWQKKSDGSFWVKCPGSGEILLGRPTGTRRHHNLSH